MAVIWIIEKRKPETSSLAAHLIGDYPVRLFASFQTFEKLLRINRRSVPDLLVIDRDDCDWPLGRVRDTLAYFLPTAPCLLVGSETTQASDLPERFYMSPRPKDGMALAVAVAAVLAGDTGDGRDVLRYRDVQLNFAQVQLQLAADGKAVSLPLKEAQILKLFLERPGICLGREEIRKRVWAGLAVSPRTIDSHVSRLRKRLEDAEVRIESVYGGGYVLR